MRKAGRGKRAKRGGTGRINEMHGSRKELQNLATSKRFVPYRVQIYAVPQVRAIKFYADFGKIMKFRAGFRHGDFGKIVKFRVEFRCDFASRRNLV